MDRTMRGTIALNHWESSSGVSNTATDVIAKQANMFGFIVDNMDNSAESWLHFYDVPVGETIVVGTTPPLCSYRIPANGFFGRDPMEIPIDHFNYRISVAVTTTRTGSTAPTNPVFVHVWYWDQA